MGEILIAREAVPTILRERQGNKDLILVTTFYEFVSEPYNPIRNRDNYVVVPNPSRLAEDPKALNDFLDSFKSQTLRFSHIKPFWLDRIAGHTSLNIGWVTWHDPVPAPFNQLEQSDQDSTLRLPPSWETRVLVYPNTSLALQELERLRLGQVDKITINNRKRTHIKY